jgi:hypothetical protein
MESLLYAGTFQGFDKHSESIRVSLAHRLEVARAANNLQLIRLLEQEQQEIVGSTPVTQSSSHLLKWMLGLKQSVSSLFRSSKPKIHQFSNGSDRWWYTTDPETGRYIYAESEAELQLWLQEHR